MAVDIGPRIGIDGEKQFRQELNNINQQLKTLGSEMKYVTSTFAENGDEQGRVAAQSEVLTRQIEAQREKVKQLEKGLADCAQKYGDSDAKTRKWEQAVYDARTELNKMENALDDVEGGLDDMGDAADNSKQSFGGFGDTLVAGLAVGAVVAAVSEITGALFDVTDKAIEFNRVMGALKTSSEAAGYTADQTNEAYLRLYGVLGDQQSAVTALANLQAIGLEQDKLIELVDLATGAWLTYGDSIPIDGLAEAINETIKSGEVTGSFSDVLRWAGESEDAFNEKMAAANSTAERAQIVMDALATQGLSDVAEGYRVAEEETIKANEAQAEYEAAVAKLGEVLLPARTSIVEFATDAFGFLADALQTVIDKYRELREASAVEIRLPEWLGGGPANITSGKFESSGNVESSGMSSAVTSGTFGAGRSFTVNITNEVGGKAVAQNQYTFNEQESARRGKAFVAGG